MASNRDGWRKYPRVKLRDMGHDLHAATLMWALISCSLFCLAGSFDVTIFKNPMEVLLDTAVRLECKITNYGSDTLNLDNLAVQWLFSYKNMTKKEIYVFNGGKHISKKAGVRMSDDLLKLGDATLELLRVQFEDEGQYTCAIFITPSKVEKSASILVSVKPRVSLSTKHFTVVSGSEGSVRCNIIRFYPQEYTIKWVKILSGSTETVVNDICTGVPVPDKDGTFNVSSVIRIEPTMVDNGAIYKCEVRHKTFSSPWITEAKLTVKEPEKTSGGAIAGAIIGTLILSTLAFAGLFFVYTTRFKKVSPKFTKISKPATIRHQEEALISCQVIGFRPVKISITLWVKRSEQEKKKIYCWSNTMLKNPDEEANLLSNGKGCCDESFTPNFSLTSLKDGNSTVNCVIKMWPDMYSDNGMELTFEVQHETLWIAMEEKITLEVVGVPPKISDILLPPRIIHNELVSLACSINGFKPKPLKIIWYQLWGAGNKKEIAYLDKDTKRLLETNPSQTNKFNHYISEMQYEDKTYSVISVLNIIPDIQEDMGIKYVCEVHHEATDKVEKRETKLDIKGTPKLEQIQSVPKTPVAGESLKLSCRVNFFYPKTIRAEWFKDNEQNPLESEDSEPMLGNNALFYFTSNMTTVATRKDVDSKYVCKMYHESLTEPAEIHWVLDRLVSAPKLMEIEIDPPSPEAGKSVTLSCKAYDFYPKENKISWIRGFDITGQKFESEDTEQDLSTGLYYRKSKWTFIPTELDHGTEYTMEILHVETSSKPQRISRMLNLKGIPSISDIILEPPEPVYGKELVLTCNVSNFTTQSITTSWLKQNNKIYEGITNQGPDPDEGGCYRFSSSLKLVPNAQDYEKEFSFRVEHMKFTKPIVKNAFVSFPAFSPQVSKIKVDPVSPQVNQAVSLSISLSNYVPSGITVKWFKKWKPYTGTVINSLPQVAENGLFSSISKIDFQATLDDQKCEFRCEVTHEETKEIQEKDFILCIRDGDDDEVDEPVSDEMKSDDEEDMDFVSDIRCETENPKAGQPVTVACTIKGHPMDSTHITWFKGVYPYEKEDVVKKIALPDGSFKCALTFTAEKEDDGILLQCDVMTEMDPISKFFHLKLS
ncbi:uncharacterized protein LOC103174895 isoform X2 [Callorhinchus milii]|uniref:uncharacterized protein LOC103174895 isoform X2 n=1 Tax=Callorhinchus milii TaxID=7868 RepID=UPI001C3F9AED|nr:uncharacterized protein LOC103174895 isoform X2 [Callorhinchus milii]